MSDDTTKSEETKAERFKRLGNSRLGKVAAELEKLHSLANRTNYDYTDEQVGIIINFLEDQIEELAETFNSALEGRKPRSKGGLL